MADPRVSSFSLAAQRDETLWPLSTGDEGGGANPANTPMPAPVYMMQDMELFF